jgi:MFS superfamily sulfate permease-like transporter
MGAPMDLHDPGTTEIVVALSGPLLIAAYVGLILIPAWTSYGRWWERFAVAFLTLYIVGVMVGIGVGIGLGIIWSYDRWAG